MAGFVVRLMGHDPAVLHPQQLRQRCHCPAAPPSSCRSTTRIRRACSPASRPSGGRCSSSAQQGKLRFLHPVRYPPSGDRRAEESCLAGAGGAARRAAGGCSIAAAATMSAAKSGNIAEFVRNWGGAYDYMIVLDADSIMSGQALVSLAQLMEAHPEVGHHPGAAAAGRARYAVRAAAAVCGAAQRPDVRQRSGLLAARREQLLGPQRDRAAAHRSPSTARCRACRAAPPFGGEILSHDIVEAAFMRRAGYKVWLVPGNRRAAGRRCPPTSSTLRRAIGAGRRAICSTSGSCRCAACTGSAACTC